MKTATRYLLPLLLLLALPACASATGELTPELLSNEPIATSSARITVLGLGCPQCATNIDLQLKSLPGVASVAVDLGLGLVDVGFLPGAHPTVRELAMAVRDSGFTVVAVEGR